MAPPSVGRQSPCSKTEPPPKRFAVNSGPPARRRQFLHRARRGWFARSRGSRVAARKALTLLRSGGLQQPLHRLGKTLILVRGRHEGRGFLHFGAGVAHRNAGATFLEHQNIIRHVADGGDLAWRDVTELRKHPYHLSFVRLRSEERR